MNNKEIERLDNEIALANEYKEFLEIKHEECYKLTNGFDKFIPDTYEIKKKIKDFEYFKEVFNLLNKKKIDIHKKYYIMPNVYLGINFYTNELNFYFYVEDDSWLYENFIESHSGINEWVHNTIRDAYDLYSGNSSYNYAFGTQTLDDFKRIIENRPEEYKGRKYTPEQVANALESLIKFFTDKKNQTRNTIIKDLNFKFNMMKKLISEN